MKNQEKLQQELDALVQLMLDTGIAVKEEKIGSAVRVARKDHTKYIISYDDKTIRLCDMGLKNTLSNDTDNKKLNPFIPNKFGEYVLNHRSSNNQISQTILNAFKKLKRQWLMTRIAKFNITHLPLHRFTEKIYR